MADRASADKLCEPPRNVMLAVFPRGMIPEMIPLVGAGGIIGEKVLRAYPNNPAARKAMRAQAKCKKAR